MTHLAKDLYKIISKKYEFQVEKIDAALSTQSELKHLLGHGYFHSLHNIISGCFENDNCTSNETIENCMDNNCNLNQTSENCNETS